MRGVAAVAAAVIVTAATLGYALWDIDLARLWQTLAAARLWVSLPFLLVLALFYYSNAQRWRLLLTPFGTFAPRQLLSPMMIGFAANNVLPLRVGELIRAHLLARDRGLPRSGVFVTLVLERLLDLIGILCVYVVGLWMVPQAPSALRASAWIGAAGILGLAGLLSAFVFIPGSIDRLWQALAARLPDALRQRGGIYLEQLTKGLAPMRDPALATVLIAQSLGRWLLPVLLAWLSVYSFREAISLPLAMITIGITAFAVSLPSAPGFVGPIQAAFVLALTPFGVEREIALAASVLFLLGHWIPVTGVGVVLLIYRHKSFRQLAMEAE